MPAYKNIILDMGGVIFDIDHSKAQQAFQKLGITDIQHLFSHKGQSDIFDRLERGELIPEDFYEEIRALTTHGLTDHSIQEAFNALLIGVPDAAYFPLLLNLRSTHRVFLLSNNNRIHYNWIIDYLQGRWNLPSFGQFFEKEYYSHLVGMRKPNTDIFELVLNEQKLNPDETLFIDDSAQHIKTASELGIHTYHKMQEENLAEVLKKVLA